MSEIYRNPTKDIELLELAGGALGTEGKIQIRGVVRDFEFDIKYLNKRMEISWIYGRPSQNIVSQLKNFFKRLDKFNKHAVEDYGDANSN